MVSVREAMSATPEAVMCTSTDWPAATGKLGVSSTWTCGGMGVWEATSVMFSEVVSSPSERVILGWYVPACGASGVQVSSPVVGLRAAPAGRLSADHVTACPSGSAPPISRLNACPMSTTCPLRGSSTGARLTSRTSIRTARTSVRPLGSATANRTVYTPAWSYAGVQSNRWEAGSKSAPAGTSPSM